MLPVDERLSRTTAILLAGGASSRMGRNKALLDRDGRPLWEHVRTVIAAAGVRQVLLSGVVPDLPPGEQSTPDVVPGLGPLAGIASVVGAHGDTLSRDWLLVVPVDLPLLEPAVLEHLCVAGFGVPGAHYAGHALPALFANTLAFRQALAAALRADVARDRSATTLHRAIGAREVPLPRALERMLTNTNTPAEWADALTRRPDDTRPT